MPSWNPSLCYHASPFHRIYRPAFWTLLGYTGPMCESLHKSWRFDFCDLSPVTKAREHAKWRHVYSKRRETSLHFTCSLCRNRGRRDPPPTVNCALTRSHCALLRSLRICNSSLSISHTLSPPESTLNRGLYAVFNSGDSPVICEGAGGYKAHALLDRARSPLQSLTFPIFPPLF